MHSIIQNLDVKTTLYKSLKDTKLKNTPNMFRIVCDPSSESIELYLTEIIRSGSQMFVVCLVGVWQRTLLVPSPSYRTHTHTLLVQSYAAKHRPSTRRTSVNRYEFQSNTALYSLMMDHIRSETYWSDF